MECRKPACSMAGACPLCLRHDGEGLLRSQDHLHYRIGEPNQRVPGLSFLLRPRVRVVLTHDARASQSLPLLVRTTILSVRLAAVGEAPVCREKIQHTWERGNEGVRGPREVEYGPVRAADERVRVCGAEGTHEM